MTHPFFQQFLSQHAQKRILLVTHAGCDVDALASAGALQHALKQKKITARIAVPDHINADAKHLAGQQNISFLINPDLSLFDVFILIDANAPSRLGSLSNDFTASKKPFFILDHHHKAKQSLATKKNALINESAIASTIVVYHFLKASGYVIDKKIATLIAAGILFDSANFLIGNTDAFHVMADCLSISKQKYNSLHTLISRKRSMGEKTAVLKAAKRAQIIQAGNYLFAFSHVSYFDKNAANALLLLGCDVAFVAALHGKKLLVLGRASNSFVKKTHFNIARDVIHKLESTFKGSGGGHTGAATFNGTASSLQPVLAVCKDYMLSFIKKKQSNAQITEF